VTEDMFLPAYRSRYDDLRSAAADLAAASCSSGLPPWPDAQAMANLIDSYVHKLAQPHNPANRLCGCAACTSTEHYAAAADQAARSRPEPATWHHRMGDFYHAAHRVAMAVGWQWPGVDASGIEAERARAERRALRERWAYRSAASRKVPSPGGRPATGRRP